MNVRLETRKLFVNQRVMTPGGKTGTVTKVQAFSDDALAWIDWDDGFQDSSPWRLSDMNHYHLYTSDAA